MNLELSGDSSRSEEIAGNLEKRLPEDTFVQFTYVPVLRELAALDHRGIVGLDPIGALAQLQLGRVFASSGDKAKAKAAYESFLALWKDADPDVPILKSARTEYTRL